MERRSHLDIAGLKRALNAARSRRATPGDLLRIALAIAPRIALLIVVAIVVHTVAVMALVNANTTLVAGPADLNDAILTLNVIGAVVWTPTVAVIACMTALWPVLVAARRWGPGASDGRPLPIREVFAHHVPSARALLTMALAGGVLLLATLASLIPYLLPLLPFAFIILCRAGIWPLALLEAPRVWGLRATRHILGAVGFRQSASLAAVVAPRIALPIIAAVAVVFIAFSAPLPVGLGARLTMAYSAVWIAAAWIVYAAATVLPAYEAVYRRVRTRLPWLLVVGQPTTLVEPDEGFAPDALAAAGNAMLAGPGLDAPAAARRTRGWRWLDHAVWLPVVLLVASIAFVGAVWWWPPANIDEAWYEREAARLAALQPPPSDTASPTPWSVYAQFIRVSVARPVGDVADNHPIIPPSSNKLRPPDRTRDFEACARAQAWRGARTLGVTDCTPATFDWNGYRNDRDRRSDLLQYVDWRIRHAVPVAAELVPADAMAEVCFIVRGLSREGGEGEWCDGADAVELAMQGLVARLQERLQPTPEVLYDDFQQLDDALLQLDDALGPSIDATVRTWLYAHDHGLPSRYHPMAELLWATPSQSRSLELAPTMIDELKAIAALPSPQFDKAVHAWCNATVPLESRAPPYQWRTGQAGMFTAFRAAPIGGLRGARYGGCHAPTAHLICREQFVRWQLRRIGKI